MAAFAQRGHDDAQNIEAEEEILAKEALFYQDRQVHMGGGDAANIHRPRGFTADGADLARLQDAQELSLQGQGQVTNLVEENGPFFGFDEKPASRAGCACEGAACVTEELAFEELLGQGRAIDRDKGAFGARPAGVNGLGNQLFTGSRLARNEH